VGIATGANSVGALVPPKAGLDVLPQGKNSCYCRESRQKIWLVQAVIWSLYCEMFMDLVTLAMKNAALWDVTYFLVKSSAYRPTGSNFCRRLQS
jgi:hypothetical protein